MIIDLPIVASNSPIESTTVKLIENSTKKEEKKSEVSYRVVKGDNLTKIAKSQNTTVQRLWDKNIRLTNPDRLEVDEVIIVPAPEEVLPPRPLYRLPEPKNVSQSPTSAQSTGLNGYAYPSCTGHVALKRYVPPGWGNAGSWKQGAINAGWTVSSTPVPGAIGWRPGHVVYVESVNPDGSITISENNYDWNGSTRTITISPSQYQYLY